MICKACKKAPATRSFQQDRSLWTISRRRSPGRRMAWCETCWAVNVKECEESRLRVVAAADAEKAAAR